MSFYTKKRNTIWWIWINLTKRHYLARYLPIYIQFLLEPECYKVENTNHLRVPGNYLKRYDYGILLSRKVCFCQLFISLWNVTCAFFSFTALYVLIQIPNAYLFARAPILPKLQNYTFSILGSQNISGIINPLFMRSHAWIWMEINGLHSCLRNS